MNKDIHLESLVNIKDGFKDHFFDYTDMILELMGDRTEEQKQDVMIKEKPVSYQIGAHSGIVIGTAVMVLPAYVYVMYKRAMDTPEG